MSSNPKWPRPGESAVERARSVALMYRQHLRAQSVPVCDQLDRLAVELGEAWAAPTLVVHEPDQAVTTDEAAELAGVTPEMIRHWARLPHPDDPSSPLLPRFKRRGRYMTYLTANVQAALEAYRRSTTRQVSPKLTLPV